MSNRSFFFRLRRKVNSYPRLVFQKIRILKYKFFSDSLNVVNNASYRQPVLISGLGKIRLGTCTLGLWPSPYYLNGYVHLEARKSTAEIVIEDGVWINNNAVIIAEQKKITIGKNTLIGTEFTVYDSDFHELHPSKRLSGKHKAASVHIGNNVFIGSRVTILKGVTVGDNSVISAGSVVSTSIPSNVVVGGVPAKLIKYLA